MILNSKLLTKFSKCCIVKLLSIVSNKHLRNPKVADNIFLDEAFDVLLSDLCQGLRFYTFSEVINSHHYELHLPIGNGPRMSSPH